MCSFMFMMCLRFCCFMKITRPLLTKPLHEKFFGVFPFSYKKTMHDPMFLQGFLGNQSFSIKTKIILVFVLKN